MLGRVARKPTMSLVIRVEDVEKGLTCRRERLTAGGAGFNTHEYATVLTRSAVYRMRDVGTRMADTSLRIVN